MGRKCECAAKENFMNEIRKCGRSHLAVFYSLTLCAAVRASAVRLSLISRNNSELNSEPQAAASFGSHQSLFFSCTKCCAAPISLVHAAPNFSLLSSTNFSLVLSSTKFSLVHAAPNSSLLSGTKFLFAQQHQLSLCCAAPNFLLCSAAPNSLLLLFTTLH